MNIKKNELEIHNKLIKKNEEELIKKKNEEELIKINKEITKMKEERIIMKEERSLTIEEEKEHIEILNERLKEKDRYIKYIRNVNEITSIKKKYTKDLTKKNITELLNNFNNNTEKIFKKYILDESKLLFVFEISEYKEVEYIKKDNKIMSKHIIEEEKNLTISFKKKKDKTIGDLVKLYKDLLTERIKDITTSSLLNEFKLINENNNFDISNKYEINIIAKNIEKIILNIKSDVEKLILYKKEDFEKKYIRQLSHFARTIVINSYVDMIEIYAKLIKKYDNEIRELDEMLSDKNSEYIIKHKKFRKTRNVNVKTKEYLKILNNELYKKCKEIKEEIDNINKELYEELKIKNEEISNLIFLRQDMKKIVNYMSDIMINYSNYNLHEQFKLSDESIEFSNNLSIEQIWNYAEKFDFAINSYEFSTDNIPVEIIEQQEMMIYIMRNYIEK